MGGAVSSGQNNDELIDNLKEAEYIKTPLVERVFRIVDRAHYYLADCRENAYKDLAWKSGTLHLSAPCIYSEVMEALDLEAGMSFLNLGSGTGYLNTMVGLVIGPYGINHGIELHGDNVTYANEKLESFMKTGRKFDDLELCVPHFVVGNCLTLAPENRLYDRVYCGASCPPEQREIIQNMVKINGILVVPVGDQLLKIKRMSDTEFASDSVLPVSFASLVPPSPVQKAGDPIVLPEVNPLSLQCICRIAVRDTIRATFDFNLPPPSEAPPSAPKPRRVKTTKFFRHEGGRYPLNILPTAQGLMIMGAFDHSNDEDDDDVEDDADASEASDDDFLDRQLRHHASELRRAGERAMRNQAQLKIGEVDSEVEEDEGVNCDAEQSEDVNGNKKDDKEDAPDLIDMEDEMEADYGNSKGEEELGNKGAELNGKKDGETKLKNGTNGPKKAVSNGNRVESATGFSFVSPYERITDRLFTFMTTDTLPSQSGTNGAPAFSSERSTSLSSDDDVIVSNISARSPAIQVTPSPNHASQPRSIKASYSTSADTSETSGFGSLSDDVLHIGSHNSGLGSLRDELELVPPEECMSTSPVSSDIPKASTASRSSPFGLSADNDNLATNGAGPGWMDIEEDDDADCDDSDDEEEEEEEPKKIKNEDKAVDDIEEEDDQEDTPPRGPDFSAYLKEKVHTLPIPSSLKAFILYYR